MANEFKLSYTAADIDTRLGKIDKLAEKSEVPKKLSDLTNDSDFATESYVDFAVANIDIPEVDLSDYALKSDIPTDYLTAIPSEYITETELNAKGYLTEHQSLAEYAKTADLGALAKKDSLTAADVGALAADTLPTAINTALAQAKVSGEFDGTSVTVSKVTESTAENGSNIVTFSDGKTLTIKNGRTPVKGADFWTEADQESIVQQVLAVMGMHIVGVVNENNDIIFSGDLSAGTYNLKFEDVEGNVQEVGTIEIIKDDDDEPADDGTPELNYTNQIPISTDENGNILNGVGYVEGYRVNSSGVVVEASGFSTTGYIPCKNGDILRGSAGIIGDNTGWTGIVLYDENKTWIASVKQVDLAYSSKWIVNDDSSFYLDTTATPISEHGDFSYIRFHSQHISDNGMIITVNEEIQ